MSVEDNKALIRLLYDLYSRRQLDEVYKLYAPEFVLHGEATGDMSLEQIRRLDAAQLGAFSEAVVTVGNMVAEEDKVAFQVGLKVTHSGAFMGIAPTGKRVEMTNTHIVRVSASRIAEWWGTTEFPRVIQELRPLLRRSRLTPSALIGPWPPVQIWPLIPVSH